MAQPMRVCYTVDKIWDNGMHCAFTSLEHYKGLYVCAFREGVSHVFDNEGKAEGRIRILVSRDGEAWEALEPIGKAGTDMRDPKLSVTPDGRLMVVSGGSVYRDRKLTDNASYVMFSDDGRHYTQPAPVELPETIPGHGWLWRVTWYDNAGYGVVYTTENDSPQQRVYLVKTADGIHYGLVAAIETDGFPNESTVRFLPDGRMALMVRRDGGDSLGLWGVSKAPYTEWELRKTEFQLGGPDFNVLDDGTVIVGTRSHLIPSEPVTALFTGDAAGHFREALVLPSGGDTSYPGLLVNGDELWVSYYSSLGTKNASIYIAKIPLSLLKRQW